MAGTYPGPECRKRVGLRLPGAGVGYPQRMTPWIVLIVLIVALVVGLALWARSRRRGGIIATPPSRPSRRPDGDGER